MVKLKIDTWCNRHKARVNTSDQSFAIGVSLALDWLREFSWPIRARSKDKLVQSTQRNATLFRYVFKEHFILISTPEKKVNFADPVKEVYIRNLKTLLLVIFLTRSHCPSIWKCIDISWENIDWSCTFSTWFHSGGSVYCIAKQTITRHFQANNACTNRT